MADEKQAQHSRDLDRIAALRLLDDEFLSEALDGKIAPVQEIVNIVLERTDMKVISVKSQVTYRSATKRSVRLDVKAEIEGGEIVDIEIQRADQGASARRARFYSSMIERTMLDAGESFDALPDLYVVFITENDIFRHGLPLYHIDRTVSELAHAAFHDGSHIIYVNGQFQNSDHPVGRLMHDFFCTRAEDMLNPLLAEEVRYLKETEGGHEQMSRIFEELWKEAENEKAIQIARQFLAEGDSPEKVARCTGLSLDVVRELAGEKSA